MATPSDPTDPIAGAPADKGAAAPADAPPAAPERRRRPERRQASPGEREDAAPPEGGIAGSGAGAARRPGVDRSGTVGGGAERRRRKRRRGERSAESADGGERSGGASRLSRRRESIRERRQERQLTEKRRYWTAVRREVERLKLEGFLNTITQLAQLSFGPSATVMPHLRGKGARSQLIVVVDAAHPEAGTAYDDFLPLERQFWTAYGTLAKPAASVTVAVRPARGWLASEEKAPLFTQFGGGGFIS